MTNFWQDVARDYSRGRIYIPLEILERHGYSEEMLSRRLCNEAWVSTMRDVVQRTRPLFMSGLQLCNMIEGRIRFDIELFSRGGLEILRAIEAIGYDTLHHRPVLTTWREIRLIVNCLLRRARPRHTQEQ